MESDQSGTNGKEFAKRCVCGPWSNPPRHTAVSPGLTRVSHPGCRATESWAIMELLKAQCNSGRRPSVYFLRNKQGHELDAVIELAPSRLKGVEIKSGATIALNFFKDLDCWRKCHGSDTRDPWMNYGGDSWQRRERGHVVPWNGMDKLLEELVSAR